MKVNGTDPVTKLLLELNNQNFMTPASGEKVNIENLSNQIEEILTQSNEVILRGDLILKTEIQFTRQLHETPEVYLQRISSEMIKMKGLRNNIQEEQKQLLYSNDDTFDIVLRAGLLKDIIDKGKQKKSDSDDATETRWLMIFSVSFITILLIYLIFLN